MIDDSESVAPLCAPCKWRARIFTPEEGEQIRATYAYDPDTGVFRWKKVPKFQKMKIGDVAGSISDNGTGEKRLLLSFNRRQIKAHRVAFFLMTGRWAQEIDHVDNNPLNNVWSNIRECTHAENQRNRKKPKHNTSGYKGVVYLRSPGIVKRFQGQIFIHGKCRSLGCFHTPEEARDAYLSAVLFLHGEFVNFG